MMMTASSAGACCASTGDAAHSAVTTATLHNEESNVRICAAQNSGMVSTPETPFGGVKESGHGSEGGIEGLGAYLNTKFISQG